MKRILSIQDISCFGRCSQTVALPIISALGIETVILPTAILSSHTGNFKNYSFLSLADEMKKITAHWKEIDISFDAIYVGYIGTTKQVKTVSHFIDTFKKDDTIIYIDPAIADNNKIYAGFDEYYIKAIKELCKKANIISPNIYEAMLLTKGYCYNDYTLDDAKNILNELKNICDNPIITGVPNGSKITSLGFDKNKNKYFYKENDIISGMYHGTGDVFASAFIGTYVLGATLEQSTLFSDDFVHKCIEKTLDEATKYWYGINFEKCISYLTDFAKKYIDNP